MRITLIEDNKNLAKGIENFLRDQGHAVDWLPDGAEADQYLATQSTDLAIVDINLPGMNGFEVVRSLRRRGSAVPVIFLTARGETHDRVQGLDAGADDYLVKPFEMAELAARIRALSRRRPDLRIKEESIGNLSFDREGKRLTGPDGNIDLPRREMALFECLLENAGRIVPKERISDHLYGVGSDVEPNAIELLVSRLRRKLAGTRVEIRTARGLGYLMDDADAV